MRRRGAAPRMIPPPGSCLLLPWTVSFFGLESAVAVSSSSPGLVTTGHGHVHVFREGKLVLKWDLDRRLPMEGVVSRRLLKLLRDLDREGKL